MPSVSACVFRDGEIVWASPCSESRTSARAATTDDVYRIGSITKTFTAVLVMQLVAEGRIELDGAAADVPARGAGRADDPDGASVTSPACSGSRPGRSGSRCSLRRREELLVGLADAELVLPPGEHWHYSNLVFALLGEIVMRVTGAGYADLLQRRILDPLGLSADEPAPRGAEGEPVLRRPVRRHRARRARPGA